MGEVAPADVFGAVAAMADAWDGTCGLSNMRTRHGPTDSQPYRPLASIVHSAQRYVIDFIFWCRYPLAMTWAVAFHRAFVPEFRNLPRQVQDEVYAVGRLLERFGPQLGWPQVDTLNGSRHANMKELRLSAADGEWRLLSTPNAGPCCWSRARSRAVARGGSTALSSAKPMNASTGTLPSSPMKEDPDDREP